MYLRGLRRINLKETQIGQWLGGGRDDWMEWILKPLVELVIEDVLDGIYLKRGCIRKREDKYCKRLDIGNINKVDLKIIKFIKSN